ncbi:MAG: NAD-dependent DNA ligase LigA, partial [Ureaplasma sp.]|nr:NAD-dependent DNA ligase LigA [Ureaplasma sp.]
MKNKVLEEINELKQKIDQWNYEYYVLDAPSVEDAIYDKAMLRLKSLEQEYPEFKTPDSPTNRVGGYVSSKFEKRKHSTPMLSLDNAFNEADLAKFDQNVAKVIPNTSYIIEPKIDGLSISLIYENSKLKYALTRGDGQFGEDVTANVYTIKSIPLFIDKKYQEQIIEVRGEIFIDKNEFKRINDSLEDYQKKFANPRNAAAGSLRNLDSSICASRNLKAYFYYSPSTKELGINSQDELLKWLKDNKFPVAQEIKLVHGLSGILDRINYFIDVRDKLSYQIDGIVIKVNNYNAYDEIGFTTKFPKWAIAYKFPAEIGLTKITNIFGDVGRTGKITYVAELEPILLDGSIISKVTLNNAEYIQTKDVRVNDYAFIYKAGDVIPYLDFVDLTRRTKDCIPFKEYEFCPSCQSKLVRLNQDVDQRCINPHCDMQIIRKLAYYCERNCMDISGLSEMMISK